MLNHKHQSGAGLLSFLIVATLVILLSFSAIELIHWLNLRQALSLSLTQTIRAGITNHAKPIVLATTFEHSLNYVYPNKQTITRLLKEHKKDLGLAWQIKIISPSPKAFLDHQSTAKLALSQKRPLINNYYQNLQHQNNIKSGWSNGNGPNSGVDIYQANILTLELTWPHQPAFIMTKKVLKALAHFSQTNQHIMHAGYLPIVRKASMVMQSHPALWQDLTDKRVIYATTNWFDDALIGQSTEDWHSTSKDQPITNPETELENQYLNNYEGNYGNSQSESATEPNNTADKSTDTADNNMANQNDNCDLSY